MKPINQERDAEILRRLDRGESPIVVAKGLGLTRSIVAGVKYAREHPYECVGYPRGEHAPGAKLTDVQIVEIRKRRASGERLQDLSAAFGVTDSAISRIALKRVRAAPTPKEPHRKPMRDRRGPDRLALIGVDRPRAPYARGELSPHAKLSDNDVSEIVRRRAMGERVCDLAEEFGISGGRASIISRGVAARQLR